MKRTLLLASTLAMFGMSYKTVQLPIQGPVQTTSSATPSQGVTVSPPVSVSPITVSPITTAKIIQPKFDGVFDDATAVQSIINYDIQHNIFEYDMPPAPAGKCYHFKSKISIIGTPFFTFYWNATALPWNSIQVEHDGVAVESMGMKYCTFSGIRMILMQSNSIGFDNSGDINHQSDSNSTYRGCRVQMYWGDDHTPATKNCTGFRVGNTGNDHSFIVYDRCDVFGDSTGSPADIPGSIQRAHAAGHRAFEMLGGNTCAMRFMNDTMTGVDVGISTGGRPGELTASGGNNFRAIGCGGSFNNCCYVIDAGYSASMWGDEWEECGGYALIGSPFQSGRGIGRISISDIEFRAGHAENNDKLGYLDKGSFINVNSNSNVAIANFGGYGEVYNQSTWIGIRSNLNPGPTITVAGSFFTDVTKVPFARIPLSNVITPIEQYTAQ